MKRIDTHRYEFLLQLHDDGMLTPAMAEELDHLESLITGAQDAADAAREENHN